jgi:hypothetical protein
VIVSYSQFVHASGDYYEDREEKQWGDEDGVSYSQFLRAMGEYEKKENKKRLKRKVNRCLIF